MKNCGYLLVSREWEWRKGLVTKQGSEEGPATGTCVVGMASGSGMVGPGGQQLVQMAVTGLMDTTPEDNLDSSSDHDESDKYEPQLKQRRVDVDFDVHGDASVKQILFNINKAICMRLDNIESCLNGLSNRQREIEQKVDTICSIMKQNSAESGDGNGPLGSIDSIAGLGPNVTLITLNSEEDYPYGSWMGDENNVEMRVRCPITPRYEEEYNQDVYLQGDLDGTGLVTGEGLHGEVQILHATPEQISQLQHAHHIQILQGDQVIQVPVPSNIQSLSASDLPEGLQVAVSAVSLPGIMSETSPIIQLADTHNTSHADS
ncbi:BANP-like protein [Mya arenaria]|uniref:BANP-like protein n=1 Tax=Mya arenaria TaxID=6604 RepID=A0ABY7EUA8_MYAAR|nr:BANP-like protein [Mya arenaria]